MRERLIERLRERLDGPQRRTDCGHSRLQQEIRSATVDELLAARQKASDDLNELVEAQDRREPRSRHVREKALAAYRRLKSPGPRPDPAPASRQSLEELERHLGRRLPEAFATIYMEVADGGFGPGYGLLPMKAIAEKYTWRRSHDVEPPWPEGMLPITNEDAAQYCIQLPCGRIMRFDPDRLNDSNSNLPETFTEVAPSLELWLEQWLDPPTAEEVAAFEAKRQFAFAEAREACKQRVEAYIVQVRKQSPDERAKLGLTGEGWEELLRKGLLGHSED